MKFLLLFFLCSQAMAFEHQHTLWNDVLAKHVTAKDHQSYFNYKKLKTDDHKLETYLKSLASVSKKEFDTFSSDQKLAFLINAYNAFTVKWILKHYPTKSIKKTTGIFSSPWKKEFFSLLGDKASLDHIEHELIRKKFAEPRIHFAVNCASIGCPSLFKEAFVATKLEEQLAATEKNFFSNTLKNYYDSKENIVYLSKIFDWYAEDFNKHRKSVRAYVATFFALNEQTTIKYLNYDWDLNELK